MKQAIVLAVWIVSLAFGLAQDQSRRPMTVDDWLNMVRVEDAVLSPDGEWVVYGTSHLDWKGNKRTRRHHFVSSGGGEAFQYLGEPEGDDLSYSPDGKWLAFTRKIEKKAQIFVMRTIGGEARQLTRHGSAVESFRWGGDSARLFFVSDDPLSQKEEKSRKDGQDAIWVDEQANGQRIAHWRNLWSVGISDKKVVAVTNEQFRVSGFDVHPSGSKIAFVARFENRRNQGNLAEIYLHDLENGSHSRLTDNAAPEDDPLWSPDGRYLAFTAPDDRDWLLKNEKIWILDTQSGEQRLLTGRFEGNIGEFAWRPDGQSILFTGLQRTNSNLFEVRVETGEIHQRTHVKGRLVVKSFSKQRDVMVFTYEDAQTPPDFYVSTTSSYQPVRLTELNPWIPETIALASAEVIGWKSRDGLEIEGLLYLPATFSKGTRWPLILHVHGGPAGVFDNRFVPRQHIYAGLGYVSLCPNVRGSSGYTDALLRGNRFDIGGGDFQDLMSGVDHLIAQGYVDSERMGVRGWSYGGILGGWTITQTNRFKAASLGAMVSDWTSEYGPGFHFDVKRWYIGKTPWENAHEWRQRSALTHVAAVQTPTILFHGMKDLTDTEPQSMMFYAALRDLGVPTRYLRFPREPHGFS